MDNHNTSFARNYLNLLSENNILSKGKQPLGLGVQDYLFERSTSVMILEHYLYVIHSHSKVIYLQIVPEMELLYCQRFSS